jgi:hypothetical protein
MLTNIYTEYRVRKEQLADQVRQAESRRLLREAGLMHKVQLRWSACWLLCQLGKRLVTLGENLQRYGQPVLAAQER